MMVSKCPYNYISWLIHFLINCGAKRATTKFQDICILRNGTINCDLTTLKIWNLEFTYIFSVKFKVPLG